MLMSLRLFLSLFLVLGSAKLSCAAPIPIVGGLLTQTQSVCPSTDIGIARSPNLSTSANAAKIVANDCGAISANPDGVCGSYGADSNVACGNLNQPSTALTPDGTHWTCTPAIGSCTSLQNGVVEVIACCTRTNDATANSDSNSTSQSDVPDSDSAPLDTVSAGS
ncbi:hypothetical protein J3R30DRAFT_36438 [Lentinula aciculospora]|uniref:Secreted protein n=1 Tax=Lentinula aciculospora TaxID=153920 RepID=A0A9W9AVT2_9AGAR|nr:hypothetical protein J3R30DRAFT_36438 [Lentinula aciculospora]